MSSVEVRPFRRADREQLTQLVNVHAAAVILGKAFTERYIKFAHLRLSA